MATSRLPPNWLDVLNHIQGILTQALVEVDAREQIAASFVTSQEGDKTFSLAEEMPRFADRLCNLGEMAPRARHTLEPVDKILQDGEQELRSYLEKLVDLRQRLANRASRAVG